MRNPGAALPHCARAPCELQPGVPRNEEPIMGTKAAGYRLATYQSADGPRAALVVEDKVFDAAKLTGKAAYASVIGILDDWKVAAGALNAAAARAAKSRVQSRSLKSTKLLAPVLWPSAIFCAGANYADH